MASLYIRYYQSLAKDATGATMPAVDESTACGEEAITIGASSTPGGTLPGKAKYAMLHAEAACHYIFGISPTASASTSMRMPADLTLIVGCSAGPNDKKFAVIQD